MARDRIREEQTVVEVAFGRWGQWGWRCHACDLTTWRLTEDEARRQARAHIELTRRHQQITGEVRRGA